MTGSSRQRGAARCVRHGILALRSSVFLLGRPRGVGRYRELVNGVGVKMAELSLEHVPLFIIVVVVVSVGGEVWVHWGVFRIAPLLGALVVILEDLHLLGHSSWGRAWVE